MLPQTSSGTCLLSQLIGLFSDKMLGTNAQEMADFKVQQRVLKEHFVTMLLQQPEELAQVLLCSTIIAACVRAVQSYKVLLWLEEAGGSSLVASHYSIYAHTQRAQHWLLQDSGELAYSFRHLVYFYSWFQTRLVEFDLDFTRSLNHIFSAGCSFGGRMQICRKYWSGFGLKMRWLPYSQRSALLKETSLFSAREGAGAQVVPCGTLPARDDDVTIIIISSFIIILSTIFFLRYPLIFFLFLIHIPYL